MYYADHCSVVQRENVKALNVCEIRTRGNQVRQGGIDLVSSSREGEEECKSTDQLEELSCQLKVE